MAPKPKKSQEESEQPAKVYQLDAIAEQIDSLAEQFKEGFRQVNANITVLQTKSESQITPQAFQENLTAIRNALEREIKEEIEKIHLEYRPLKENTKWLVRGVVGILFMVIGQLVSLLILSRNP